MNGEQAIASSTYAAKTDTIEAEPVLVRHEKMLTEAAMVLSMTIDRAASQLQPVLGMEAPHEVGSESNDVDSRSPHVRALDSITARIHEQNDRLTRLLDRLEV